MRLIQFGPIGSERLGILDAQGVRRDASAFYDFWHGEYLAPDMLARMAEWLERLDEPLPTVPDDVRWGPPIQRPSKIVCIGLNYRDHARETGAKIPEEPILFAKATSSVVGPYDDLRIAPGSEKTDWEVEVAIVMGRRATRVSEADALSYVAGYALHNDYSERHFQLERGGQWFKGKSWDTFAPIGPWLATRDEIADPQNIKLWLSVNGEQVQNSSTAEMIFGMAFLVHYVSQFMTLLPGDVISTGTPAGVGLGFNPPRYLRPGDVVSLGADGLGSSRQRVVEWVRQPGE